MKRSKYGVRTDAQGKAERTVDGILFASKREARRYSELSLLAKAGKIKYGGRQPKFRLEVNGELICTYIADFQYLDLEKQEVITEDVKGHKTAEYKLKKKLMHAIYGIEIQEV